MENDPKATEETKALLSMAIWDRLEHEGKGEGGTSNTADASLEGRGAASRLTDCAGGGCGSGGAERRGNGKDTSGLDDGAVLGQASAVYHVASGLGGGRDDARHSRLAGSAGRAGRAGCRVAGRLGGAAGNGVAGRGRGGDRGSRRLNAAVLGDAELGRVLVETGHVVDDLDAVAGVAGGSLEGGSGSPGKRAAVGDALGERRAILDDVGGRALEEQDGDGVGGGGLPGDGEGLAGRDNLGRC